MSALVTLELSHYSADPFDLRREIRPQRLGMKPEGLWVSVDADPDPDGECWGWAAWCRSEEFRLGTLDHRQTVELQETARILWLRSVPDMLDFDRSYSTERYYIDWARVADDWQGVVITPYQWSMRHDGPDWYYGWDCASGCIWDTTAVKSMRVAP